MYVACECFWLVQRKHLFSFRGGEHHTVKVDLWLGTISAIPFVSMSRRSNVMLFGVSGVGSNGRHTLPLGVA